MEKRNLLQRFLTDLLLVNLISSAYCKDSLNGWEKGAKGPHLKGHWVFIILDL